MLQAVISVGWTSDALPRAPARLTSEAAPGFRWTTGVLLGLALVIGVSCIALDGLIRIGRLESQPTLPRLLAAAVVALAGVVAVLAGLERRARELSRRRLAFLLMSTGLAIIFGGQMIGYVMTAGEAGKFVAGVEDIPMCLGSPIFAAGLILVSWPPGMTKRDLLFVVGDGLVAALGLVVVGLLIILPAEPASTTDTLARMLDPWAQFLLVLAVLMTAATSRRTGSLPIRQLILLQSAPLVYVAADIGGDVLPAGDASSIITWSIVGYAVSAILFTTFCAHPAVEAEPPGSARLRDIWSVLLPFLPLPLAIGSLILRRVSNGPLGASVIATATVGLTLVVGFNLVMRLLLASDVRKMRDAKISAQLEEGTKSDWFAALVGDSRDLITVVDGEGLIVYQTPSVLGLLGYRPEEFHGRPFGELLTEPEGAEHMSRLLVQASHDCEARGPHELTLQDSRGTWHETETVVTPLRTHGSDGFVLTTRDISDRRRLRAELAASEARDGLTGLSNRDGFLARLREELPASRPDTLAVALIDLDAFRDINDGRGHDAGDEVLRTVAAALDRLPDSVRAVSRNSGDEFGILVVGDDGAEPEVGRVERELRQALASVLLADGSQLRLGFAFGYVVRGRRDVSAVDLMERADLALSAARTATEETVVRYEPTMRSALVGRLRAEADLRDALDQGRLEVHYQPVVDLGDGSVRSVEALARLRGADGALVPPDVFIPIAEDLGLIHRVGHQVLQTTLRDAAAMAEEFQRPIGVAVNVSGRQIDAGFAATVTEALAESGADPSLLTLELTETALADNQGAATRVLDEVRAMGCSLAIDDFGTGYSSLSYLASMPFNVLKIDASFTGRLGSSSASLALVRTMIQLSQALGLRTIAEGVETLEQADILRGMGCTFAQGYLYAKPLALTDLLLTAKLSEGILPLLPSIPAMRKPGHVDEPRH